MLNMFNGGRKEKKNSKKGNEDRVYTKTSMTPEESEKMGKITLEKNQRTPLFMKQGQRVPDVEVVNCSLPPQAEGKFAVVVNNVFSREECHQIIDWTESNLDYTPAMLNIGRGMQILDLRARKHDRAIYDSKELVDYIMERIIDHMPQTFQNRNLSCLNERCRFLRYGEGNYFAPHYDGQYKRPDGSERSYFTILFYLNDDFEGATTNFLGRWGECLPVPFNTGSILIFEHDIYHEGAMLLSGMKYLMRTDVMYLSARNDKKKKGKKNVAAEKRQTPAETDKNEEAEILEETLDSSEE